MQADEISRANFPLRGSRGAGKLGDLPRNGQLIIVDRIRHRLYQPELVVDSMVQGVTLWPTLGAERIDPQEVVPVEQSEFDRRIEERMKQGTREKNISTPRMFLRFLRMFIYRAINGRWHLPAVTEISVDELHVRMEADRLPVLIDVNLATEFHQGYGHIPTSRSIPIGELEAALEDLQASKGEEIVTICPGGGMSLIAAEILAEAGFEDVKSLKGGSDLWFKKGYPTTRS